MKQGGWRRAEREWAKWWHAARAVSEATATALAIRNEARDNWRRTHALSQPAAPQPRQAARAPPLPAGWLVAARRTPASHQPATARAPRPPAQSDFMIWLSGRQPSYRVVRRNWLEQQASIQPPRQ
jgi:hypothetical protein